MLRCLAEHLKQKQKQKLSFNAYSLPERRRVPAPLKEWSNWVKNFNPLPQVMQPAKAELTQPPRPACALPTVGTLGWKAILIATTGDTVLPPRRSSSFHEPRDVSTFLGKVVFKLGFALWHVRLNCDVSNGKNYVVIYASLCGEPWTFTRSGMSWQLPPFLPWILGSNCFLKILAVSLPTWNSLPSFWDTRFMIISLRPGLWLYSIKVIKDVANNPFHVFMRRDYLHK